MSSEEHVIAVMGPTGVGKSSFIRNAVPPGLRTEIKVGHGIQSETNEVQPVPWNTENGTITLVDTPGFDDSRDGMTDVKVLNMIATFLTKDYKRGQKSRLSGLVYIHRISDIRIGRTSQLNLRMFQKLCGPDSLENVVIITTMWDMVSLEEGLKREQELKLSENMFKPLLDGGATIMRHHNTPQSATEVINHLLGKTATTVQIVREMAQQNKHLKDTEAGIELRTDIEGMLKKHKEEMESVNANVWGAMQCEIAEERQRLNRVITGLSEQLEDLKRAMTMTTESDSDPPSHYELTNNFPTPETKSVVHYTKLLQLIKTSESTITSAHPELSRLVPSRAIQFADAMEESVKCVQRGLASLRSARSSESMHGLRQFTNADQHPRAFTYGMWVKARDDMEMVTNHIRSILSQYPNLSGIIDRFRNRKAAKRSDALNTILKCTREVVADMNIMVYWWKPVIDALGNVEDASHHPGGTGFDDSATKLTVSRIIRALDSYYEAFENGSQQIHKAASGMLLTT